MMMGTVAASPSSRAVADGRGGEAERAGETRATESAAASVRSGGGARARTERSQEARAERLCATENLFTALAPSCEKWASRARVSIEDIRQDLYVLCLEVVLGESEYRTFAAASVYVSGRMWGAAERYREFRARPDKALPERPASDTAQAEQCLAVDELLEVTERRREKDREDAAALRKEYRAHAELSALEIMRRATWSQSRAARETGLSKATIRSRERRKRKAERAS